MCMNLPNTDQIYSSGISLIQVWSSCVTCVCCIGDYVLVSGDGWHPILHLV